MLEKLLIKSRKAGQSPGTLPAKEELKKNEIPIDINIIDFKGEEFQERNLKNIEDCVLYKNNDHVTWIDIEGTNQVEEIGKLGKLFGLHPLLIEDIVYADQRPKIDDYEDHIFITLTMLEYDSEKEEIKSEKISIV